LTLPTPTGHAEDGHPKVWPLARLEASARQPWLTSLPHERIPASTINVDRIAELDGSLDRPALQALLVAWLSEGRLGQSPDTPNDTDSIENAARQYLARAHRQLARNALLEPWRKIARSPRSPGQDHSRRRSQHRIDHPCA
jgi:hypothetical protein